MGGKFDIPCTEDRKGAPLLLLGDPSLCLAIQPQFRPWPKDLRLIRPKLPQKSHANCLKQEKGEGSLLLGDTPPPYASVMPFSPLALRSRCFALSALPLIVTNCVLGES